MKPFPKPATDPTPEQIAERAAEIRKEWTENVRIKRSRWAHSRVKLLFMKEHELFSTAHFEDVQ